MGALSLHVFDFAPSRASRECAKRKCAFFFVHERRSFAAGVKAQDFVRTVILKTAFG